MPFSWRVTQSLRVSISRPASACAASASSISGGWKRPGPKTQIQSRVRTNSASQARWPGARDIANADLKPETTGKNPFTTPNIQLNTPRKSRGYGIGSDPWSAQIAHVILSIYPLFHWIGAVGWQEPGDNCHVKRTCGESVEINLGLENRLNWEPFCDHCAQPSSYFLGRGRN